MMNEQGEFKAGEGFGPATLLGSSAADEHGGGGWLNDMPVELKNMAVNKGWKGTAEVLESYRHLEELMGVDKAGRSLVMPEGENDREGYERLYQALGRPTEPGGYELDRLLEGEIMDARFMDLMSRTMHETGLSKKQAAGLARAYQDHYNDVMRGIDAEYQRQVEEMVRDTSPADLETARRGMRLTGAGPDVIAKVEKALGPALALELFQSIGQRIGEDKMAGGAEGVGLSGPAEAGSRIAELRADPAFRQRYLSGEAAAVARMTELYRQASAK